MSIDIKKSTKPVNYTKAIDFLEKRLIEVNLNKSNELIWILEHPSTFTSGVSYDKNEILDKRINLIKTNRGGKITWHGPGQLVCYFVIDLNKRKKDIRNFLTLIEKTIITTHRELTSRFSILNPSIWISGLNPHAGEAGTIGDEEQKFIIPVIRKLQSEGYNLVGPVSADTMFYRKKRRRFDAAICMYHDQALIPIKTLDFHSSVNLTIGLSFIRTSPDHGTAFDIAGKNLANPTSTIEALKLAWNLSKREQKDQ